MTPEVLADLPLVPPLALAVAAVVLVAEAGLLVGVFLPGVSTMVAIGLLTALTPLSGWTGLAIGAVAATAGSSLGYWRARRGHVAPARLVASGPARRILAIAEHRPRTVAAVGQWIGVARTLAPRLVARRLRYHEFALVSVPAAVSWATATIGLGHLLADGIAWAGTLVELQRLLGTALLVVLLSVLVIVLVRRRTGTRS